MGIGPLEYLQLLRIEKAKKLLMDNSKSLKEIMEKVGFVNEVSLIRVFKKYEGITPGLYRKKLQQ
jgi:YesN/AraC family two-component response regulator